jgi:hypothetical protein
MRHLGKLAAQNFHGNLLAMTELVNSFSVSKNTPEDFLGLIDRLLLWNKAGIKERKAAMMAKFGFLGCALKN